ncbi:MAG: hypothetical protein Q9219_004575, partial [cf. Caloplaca sp. 3 TL-2023]
TDYNASATYQVSGFQLPGNNTTPQNWTYGTAIRLDPQGGYDQTLWIETPDGTGIGSKDLPYIGCVVALFGLPKSTSSRGRNDNGDCTKTFDQSCTAALLDMASSNTLQYSGTNNEANDVCVMIANQGIPSQCTRFTDGDRWRSTISSAAIGNSTFSNGTDAGGCRREGKDANAETFGWGFGAEGSSNETNYDQALNHITPVLTTVWLKENASGTGDIGKWSDARLTCMRAKDVKESSKLPGGSSSSGASTIRRVAATGGLTVAALELAILLL